METVDARSVKELEALGDEIARTASAISVSEHRFLSLLREFDGERGWARSGSSSCAAWLSWRCSMGIGAATERMRVARKLAEMPLVDAAFAAGEISYSKVRALTRVAGTKGEETLVEMAQLMTAAQLEKLCRMLRAGRAEGEAEKPRRYFRQQTTESGMVRMSICVTAEEAATVTRALDLSADPRKVSAPGRWWRRTPSRGRSTGSGSSMTWLTPSANRGSSRQLEVGRLPRARKRRSWCDSAPVWTRPE